MDRKLGVAQPPGYPFSLNSAVDKLLKKEFDIHRAKGTRHPLMEHYGIDAIPLTHEKICNGNTDKKAFDAKLEFDIKIIPYKGDDSWVEKTILDAITCLEGDALPESGPECDFCKYRHAVRTFEK